MRQAAFTRPARRRAGIVLFHAALWTWLLGSQARASSTGIVGYSGKQGATCQDSCHGGGAQPVVCFDGPTRVAAGALATFRFSVFSRSERQIAAGFNVAASDGSLETLGAAEARAEAGEITHTRPRPNMDGFASWQFAWRAPDQVGQGTLYGAGLSVNLNGTRGGDAVALAAHRVTVTDDLLRGDANCDDTFSAGDLIALVQALPAGAPATCTRADADGDGVLDQADLTTLIGTLFEPLSIESCSQPSS